MMARTHAAAGGVAALLILPAKDAGISWAHIGIGVALSAGAALWPDSDSPPATMARTFYAPGHAAAKIIERVAGGHRRGTHSVLTGIPLATLAVALASWVPAGSYLVLFLALAPLLHAALHHARYLTLLAAAGAAWALTPFTTPALLVFAAVVGMLSHIACDLLTSGPVYVLHPLPWPVSLPLLGRTDGHGERYVMPPALAVAALYGLSRLATGG